MSFNWNAAKSNLSEKFAESVKLGDSTLAICSKLAYKSNADSIVEPIYTSASYHIKSVDHYLDILQNDGYIYGRLGNPNCQAVEATLKNLENAKAGSLTFGCGMGAISTVLLSCLKSGDHIVCQNPLYSGTHKIISKYLINFNIQVTWIKSGADIKVWEKAIESNTKMLYGETPCNPNMLLLDLQTFAELGKAKGILTVVDMTFASPVLVKGLDYDIDVVLHSATKYLGGHTDVTAGVLSVNDVELWKKLQVARSTFGTILSPHEAILLHRGMKTLPLRMQKHSESALKISDFLENNEKVKRVFYPALNSHPNNHLAIKQMPNGCGGMIAFEMFDEKCARTVIENLKIINLAVSLGGVDSLINHPQSMTHGPMVMNDKERKDAFITPGLIRLSVGLEDCDDLIMDLKQAFDKI